MIGNLPAPPAGVHFATRTDRIREGGWVIRSLLWDRIFTSQSTTGQRLFSLAIVLVPLGALWYIGWRDGIRGLLAAAVVLLVTLALCAALLRRRRRGAQTRVYVLDDLTATLTMTADGDYWTIAGHTAAGKRRERERGCRTCYCLRCARRPVALTWVCVLPPSHRSSPVVIRTEAPWPARGGGGHSLRNPDVQAQHHAAPHPPRRPPCRRRLLRAQRGDDTPSCRVGTLLH